MRLGELLHRDRHAAIDRPLRAVRIPAAEIDLNRFDAHVGANQRRRRAQGRSEAAAGVDRTAGWNVAIDVERAQRGDRSLRIERGRPEGIPLGLVRAAEPRQALRAGARVPGEAEVRGIGNGQRVRRADERLRQAEGEADAPQRRVDPHRRQAGEMPAEPAGYHVEVTGLPDFHEELRVEVRTRGIGRTARVHYEQLP